jgi:transposase
MPIDPRMCSLCFDTVYDGEHWTDADGQRWDSHAWCHLMDLAAVARRDAAKRRALNHQPPIEN